MDQPSELHSVEEPRIRRWSIGLAAATMVSFVALVVLAWLNVRVVAIVLAFFGAGIAALATATWSIARDGDRSALTWAAFAIGLLATLLLVAEFTVLE